jgi:hypothetical protein
LESKWYLPTIKKKKKRKKDPSHHFAVAKNRVAELLACFEELDNSSKQKMNRWENMKPAVFLEIVVGRFFGGLMFPTSEVSRDAGYKSVQ